MSELLQHRKGRRRLRPKNTGDFRPVYRDWSPRADVFDARAFGGLRSGRGGFVREETRTL